MPNFELQDRTSLRPPGSEIERDERASSQTPPRVVQHLEPADKGLAAYKVLFAAFAFEGVLWGLSLPG